MPVVSDRPGPEVGTAAPEFALRDQHGATVRLSELRGRVVVLVFFPFAFSRVCTGELSALQDRWEVFDREDVVVLGLSCDPVYALRAFADAGGLELPLLADFWPHGAVATAYGVFDPVRGAPTRSTVIVDRFGTVAWTLHHDPSDPRDLEEYLAVLDRLV